MVALGGETGVVDVTTRAKGTSNGVSSGGTERSVAGILEASTELVARSVILASREGTRVVRLHLVTVALSMIRR